MTAGDRSMMLRQLIAVGRSEAAKSLAGRRLLALGVLASLPVVLALLRVPFARAHASDVAGSVQLFSQIFYVFILRFVIFFAAARAFVKTFRAEIMDETLHLSLLAPLRREVLVVGKFLGALAATSLVLCLSTVVTWILFLLPHVGHLGPFLGGTGIAHALGYVVVVVFACIGYGALFLLMGLFFRSPMVPAVVLLGWEALTMFLPKSLKLLTIVHHLAGLLPVAPTFGAFAVAASPPPWWLAAPALLAAATVFLTLATWKARRLEVSYSAD